MSSGLPLDQLGAQAHGHIIAGDKAKDKAEQHYKAAGIYLIEAKEAVFKTKGLTWPLWLAKNCPIGRRRADEIITIADGRSSLVELREKNADRNRDLRERKANPASRDAQSSEIPQQKQRPAPERPPIVEEVQDIVDEFEELRSTITARIKRLDNDDLQVLGKYLLLQFGE